MGFLSRPIYHYQANSSWSSIRAFLFITLLFATSFAPNGAATSRFTSFSGGSRMASLTIMNQMRQGQATLGDPAEYTALTSCCLSS